MLGRSSFAPMAQTARADAAAGSKPVPAVPAPPPGGNKVDDPKAIFAVPLDSSPVRGPEDALVTIVESSDFECPFCKRTVPTMKKIAETYGGKVRFAFKHNPLPMHPNAIPAAMLAEEARVQRGSDGFWAVHDKLLAVPVLDRAAMEKAGLEAGLPAADVRAAIDGQRYLTRIQVDQALMAPLGARGTPCSSSTAAGWWARSPSRHSRPSSTRNWPGPRS
jgi:protein-disulfide isomerase